MFCSPCKTSDESRRRWEQTKRWEKLNKRLSHIFKSLLQSLNLLTVLLRPGVQLLPQVDDFDAKTLLTVRPLQVTMEPSVQRHVQAEVTNPLKHFAVLTVNQRYVRNSATKLSWKQTCQQTCCSLKEWNRNCTCSAENDDLASAASSSTSSPFSFDSSQHIFLWDKDNCVWTHRRNDCLTGVDKALTHLRC